MKLAHGAEIAPGLKLVEPIGNGAMGSVWVADWDRRGERVAVKLIPERVARVKGMVERFRREAEVARRIQSHHVVSIYDLGETVSGLPYIVMEKLDGETLEDRLEREGRVSVPFAVRFVPQLGAALQAAHDVNVMHRDIKPTNLFLTGEGEAALLKVLDFGAAKEVRVKGGSIVTATGVAIGSPFMMSPEQVLGSRYVDHRTDLWSFAVVVYRMLSGQLPFVADNPSALAFTICQGKYHKPSDLGVPAALDLWFVRALQPQKERRFGSAREMAAEFLDLLGEQPLSVIEDESTFDNATTGVFQGAATFAHSHMPDPTGAVDDEPESVTLTEEEKMDGATLNRSDREILAALDGAATPAARKPANTLKGHPPPPVRAARKEAARAKAARPLADSTPTRSSAAAGLASEHGGAAPEDPAAASTPLELADGEPPDFPAPSVPPPPSDPEASLPRSEVQPAVESGLSVSPSAVSSKPPGEGPAQRAAAPSSSRYAWLALGVLAAVAAGIFGIRSTGRSASGVATNTAVAAAAPEATAVPEPPREPVPPEVSSVTAPAASTSAAPEEAPPDDTGQLSIICVPACSDVLVDGTSWGPSPIDKRSVPAGFHSIMLFRAGVSAKPTTVKINAGEHKEKKVFLDVGKPPASAPPPSAKPPPVPAPEPPPPVPSEPPPVVDPTPEIAPAPAPPPPPPPAPAPPPPPPTAPIP